MNHSRRKLLALLGLSLSLGVASAQATSLIWDSNLDSYIMKPGVTPQVSAGWGFSLALKRDGTVWSWGGNGNGELGIGNPTQPNSLSRTPVQVSGLSGVKAISAGDFHSLALKSDGTVWGWGSNLAYELSSSAPRASAVGTPVQVAGLAGVTAVAAGYQHSVALKSDGTVWTWGESYGNSSYYPTPEQVPGLTGVVGVLAGHGTSAALKSDGSVWVWGTGILGNGTDYSTAPATRLIYPSGIVGGALGGQHRVEFRGDGTAFTWGTNNVGQLGLGIGSAAKSLIPVMVTSISGVKAVSAGAEHTAALKSDGTVWTWGWNQYGQLGNGGTAGAWTPAEVRSVGGGVFNGVTQVAAGYGHTLALKSDGWVWSWGWNTSGELGVGTAIPDQQVRPVRALINLN
jgi:alpha-tubulin suppressor-like RCC1 family protein